MLRQILLVTLFLLPITGQLHAQEEILAAILENYVDEDDPGVVIFVSDGNETWTAVRGMSDLDAGTPMQVTDRFRIASMTKTFVAVLILQLAEEGWLNLDDEIGGYLPAEVISSLDNGDEITIRQLLNMTSGIYNYTDTDDYNFMLEIDPDHPWTAAETVSYVYGFEAYFDPGEGYHYSNTNYNLLEMIIAALTESTLGQQLEERIFIPLGLQDTYLETAEGIGVGLVHGYEDWDEDGVLEDVTFINDSIGLGAAGIVSTAADLDVFLRGLAAGELLSAASLAEMTAWIEDGEGGFYGLGLVNYGDDAMEAYGHSGAIGGFQSDMVYVPDGNLTVIILTNNFTTGVLGDITAEIVAAIEAAE